MLFKSILAENYPIGYELKKGPAARQKEEAVFGTSIFVAFFDNWHMKFGAKSCILM